jgi:hypothetical protein
VQVRGQGQQVAVFSDWDSLELALEEGAASFVPSIDPLGVGDGEHLHAGRQVLSGGLKQKVVVVGHQAIRDDGCARAAFDGPDSVLTIAQNKVADSAMNSA